VLRKPNQNRPVVAIEVNPARSVTATEVGTVSLVFLILASWILATGWVPLLDSTNLAFHEAGHPAVGMFSERLTVYGGTLFQLLFPLAAAVHFSREGNRTGASLSVVWLGENFHNIARYMADAREQVLPLVGNGDHDWAEIFSRWHVLHLDTRIAGMTHFIGWLLMAGAVVWLFRVWRRDMSSP
jgi:hypothetical protein